MKKNLSNIITVICCILLIISLFQNANMKRQLQALQTNMDQQISYLENSVDNIGYHIDSQLEKQASLLSDSSWAFGEIDCKTRTIELQCSISPKEYQPDTTSTVLICDGSEYPMILKDGAYRVNLTLPVFHESHVSAVQFTEGDTIRTEKLDWYLSPRYESIPAVYANYHGSYSGTTENGIYTRNYHGEISIDVTQPPQIVPIQSVSLIECINGEEVSTTDISLTAISSENSGTISSSDEGNEIASNFHYPLNRSVDIPFGSTYDMYVEVMDNYGFCHRAWVFQDTIDSDGNPVDPDMPCLPGTEAAVYDENGTVLYAPSEG